MKQKIRFLLATLLAIAFTQGAWAQEMTVTVDGLTYEYRTEGTKSGYYLMSVPEGSVNVTIPEKIDSYNVIGIAQKAFFLCKSTIVTLTMPTLDIPDYLLSDAVNLESVDWGDYMPTRIGENAFAGCTKLSSISLVCNFAKGGSEVGVWAFHGCSSLSQTISMGSAISPYALMLGHGSFYGTSVTIDCRQWSRVAFGGSEVVGPDCTVLVKAGLGKYYEKSATWGEGNIVDPQPASVNVTAIGTNMSGQTGVHDAFFYLFLPDESSVLIQDEEFKSFYTTQVEKGSYLKLWVKPDRFSSLLLNGTEMKDLHYQGNNGTFNIYQFAVTDDENQINVIFEPIASDNIPFADEIVEKLCVENWDTNGDGWLSVAEAAAVTSIGTVFRAKSFTTFDEFRYFTGVTEIEDAFRSCQELTSITLPEGLEVIGEKSFYSCHSLQHIQLPESVTTIGENAFNGCWDLVTLHIPKNVTTIVPGAFIDCRSLIAISVDEGNEKYDSREGCNAIISNDNYVTVGCKNTIILDGIYGIKTSAFQGCTGLTKIEIPASVENIRPIAFKLCSNLKQVIAYMTTPPTITETAFLGISEECVLTVPAGTKSAYMAAGWTEEVFKGGIVEIASGNALDDFVWNSTEAGTLYAELSAYPDDQLKAIKRLTVNSPINSADLFIIRKLCGDSSNDPTGYVDYGLDMLDLTNATIVADEGTGTVPYDSPYYISTDGQLPDYMFRGCMNLVEVKLPLSTTDMKNPVGILQGSKSDMIVHVPWSEVPALIILPLPDPFCGAFGNKSESSVRNKTLVVPKGSLEAYQAADGWNWFKEIREEEESGSGTEPTVLGDINGDGKVTIADVTKLVNMILGKE